jgi:hypothetical protein
MLFPNWQKESWQTFEQTFWIRETGTGQQVAQQIYDDDNDNQEEKQQTPPNYGSDISNTVEEPTSAKSIMIIMPIES